MHSILSPSSANRWVPCVGSIQLCKALAESSNAPKVQADNDSSEEGTAAHHFGEVSISERLRSLGGSKLGDVAPNGTVYTEEMQSAVVVYVEHVVMLQRKYSNGMGHVEKMIKCPCIHEECFGTPDFALFARDNAGKNPRLIVVDYKHGRVPVEVFENWQAIIYSSGMLSLIYGDKPFDDDLIIELVIVQPRAQHQDGSVRSWVTDVETLKAFWLRANSAANEALSDHPQCIAGPHCRRCPARLSCKAFGKSVGVMCDFAESALRADLTAQELGVEWVLCERAINILKARKDAATEQLKHLVSMGAVVDAIDVQRTQSRIEWKQTPEAILAIGNSQKIDLAKPPQVITPKQAMSKGLSEAMVSALSHRPKGGIKIKEANADRARFVFTQGTPS